MLAAGLSVAHIFLIQEYFRLLQHEKNILEYYNIKIIRKIQISLSQVKQIIDVLAAVLVSSLTLVLSVAHNFFLF